MTYEEFKEKVTAYFRDFYEDTATVSLQRIRKNNGVFYDGLLIRKKDCKITPTVYLNLFYENMEKEEELPEVCEEIRRLYERHEIKEKISMDFFSDFELVKDCIAIKLVNYGMNRELLEMCRIIVSKTWRLAFIIILPILRTKPEAS